MKRLLLAILLLAIIFPVSAQDNIYYSEDFNGGPNGWTVNSYLCQGTTGPHVGLYTLTSGVYNGQNITGLTAELSIYTSTEYTLQFSHGPHSGYSQGQYTVESNKFNSSLTGATFNLSGTISSLENDGHINYTSQLNITQELFDQWGRTLTGAGSPNFVKTGNTLKVTSSDGLTVLNFNKTSNCGNAWIWHPDGQVGYGALTPVGTSIVSESNENGVMSLNADWLSTRGDINNLPDSGPLPDYESELISPSIDLSDATGPVYLRFNELLLYWPAGTPNSPVDDLGAPIITSVSYSIDDGQTWIDSIDVNKDVKYMEPVGTNFFNLFPFETRFIELPGVAGKSSVKVKFNWLGTLHYWVIDDVSLQSAPESNIALDDFIFYPAANYQQPVSQIGLDTMGFFAIVSNKGIKDLTNVGLRARIFDPDGNLVHHDSLLIDVLKVGQDSLLELPNQFIPNITNTEDEYLVLYTTFSDSVDVNFSDNYELMYFRAHPDTYAKDNGGELFGFGVAASGDYQMGCFYQLDPLAGNGFEAVSAFYSVFTSSPSQTPIQILTNLYEVKETVARNFSNFNFSSRGEDDDLTVLAFGAGNMPAGESFGDITVEIGDIDGNKVPLKPGGRYFLANFYTGASRSLTHQLDSDIPYFLRIPMVYFSQAQGRWFFGVNFTEQGDAAYNVPVMHLTIQFNPTATDEKPLPDAALNIYPNPTVEQLSVDLDLEKRGPGLVIISNAEGKVLLWEKYENLQKETLNFNVKSYPAGNYFLRLGTEEGTKTLPFVKVGE